MKKLFLLLWITFVVTINIYAQRDAQSIANANKVLKDRGEVYFSFNISSHNELETLTRVLSIDNVKGNTVYAYANIHEFFDFLKYGYDIQVLTPPSLLTEVEMSPGTDQPLSWDYYPTYTNYENIMSQFVTDHPDIAQLITIGTLSSGRKLLAIKITDNPSIQENEPEFLYTSSIHGDETTGYILMLHLIDYLLTNYGVNDQVTNLVNNIEIYINPLANPDGTYHGGNNSVNGATRNNGNNVNLNRNYPDPEDGQHPDGEAWQPETVAFMNFAQQHHFTMSANFHGGAEVLNYPWDTWWRRSADDSWWQYVCKEYADTVFLHSAMAYLPPNDPYFQDVSSTGYIDGYDWYTISGGRQDYMNYFAHCREVTIEISRTKLLPVNQLINHWNYNYRSFINFLNQSIYGLHGIITDSLTGEPLSAKIFINDFDKDSSHVYTDPTVGDYHRLLKAGPYSVTFSSPGYISKTITVQIVDKQKFTLDVQLYDGSLAAAFSANNTSVNPGTEVHFTDMSAGNPTGWYWEFEGGTPAISTEQNPTITYNDYGLFDVKLKVTRQNAADSIILQDYISVAPNYIQGNYYLTTCHGDYYDTGGETGNYSDNELSAITFVPGSPDKMITIYFLGFDVEQSANCDNDRLTVYDGSSTLDPVIGNYCGTSIPESITATNTSGALTVLFRSNASITASGWNAYVVCSPNVGIPESEESLITIFPNPVIDGEATLISPTIIRSLRITDSRGRVINTRIPNSYQVKIPAGLAAGLYFVSVQTGEQWYVRKLQVVH
jgi:PKD repeat protein